MEQALSDAAEQHGWVLRQGVSGGGDGGVVESEGGGAALQVVAARLALAARHGSQAWLQHYAAWLEGLLRRWAERTEVDSAVCR